MNSSSVLSITTFVYGAAFLFYSSSWIFNKKKLSKIASLLSVVAIMGNLGGFILRWIESHIYNMGHPPLSNLYESLVFFALTIAILYMIIEKRINNITVSAFVSPLAFMSMAYASFNPQISDRIQPLIPALKSNWLIAHVITCFIGYAGFAMAFALSIMYLYKSFNKTNHLIKKLPNLETIDELTYQMVILGFLFLSIGIITGSVWANSAWGSYWSWDPKETWSLITWFIYATLLHARYMKDWNGSKIAYISIVGFIAVLFTYFGVNYLPGLHSYGAI